MMRLNDQQTIEEKRSTTAQIIASIPLLLWQAVLVLLAALVVVLILARYFPATSGIALFASGLLDWLIRILAVTGVVIALRLTYAGYTAFHTLRVKHEELKALQLANQLKQVKITAAQAETNIIQQFPALYSMALERGLNVKFKGGMEISSPFSNVHTLAGNPQNVIDANPLTQIEPPPPVRLTVEQICEHIVENSYKVYIGSSLTTIGKPIAISIKGRHLKIIGATQKGKSSFIGSLIDIVSRTHTPEYVQFALLDKEYQTSRLFEDLPHVVTVIVQDRPKKLHARNPDEVVEALAYLLQILNARNDMSRLDLSREPIIIVYVEEFLRLKKELKAACSMAQDKEEAIRKYTQFSFAIGQLAGLGLKLRMQLWICAQMDYADKDAELQEAMVNITSGLSFCVRQTAALAAGFYQTELLARNAQDNKPGRAVCEMPDCNDLILAPEYNLEALLIAREEADMQREEEEREQIAPASYTRPYLLPVHLETPETPAYTPPALPAIVKSEKRRATLTDAIEVWNEHGEMGRPRLRKELQARGLECSDDLSLKLLDAIKSRLKEA